MKQGLPMEPILHAIFRGLERMLAGYAKAFFGASKTIIEFGEFKVGFVTTRPDKRPYEDRIAKLDVAREALAESLAAIEQMKEDAQAAKDEYDATSANLQAILGSSQDAEAKIGMLARSLATVLAGFAFPHRAGRERPDAA